VAPEEPFIVSRPRSPSSCHPDLPGVLHHATPTESFIAPSSSSWSPSQCHPGGVLQLRCPVVLGNPSPRHTRGILLHATGLFLESFSMPPGSSWILHRAAGSSWKHSLCPPSRVLHCPSLGGCSLSGSLFSSSLRIFWSLSPARHGEVLSYPK